MLLATIDLALLGRMPQIRTTDTATPTAESAVFPEGLTILGWICAVGTALLSFRLVYEQTILTWQNGWQMVGFSLAHAQPAIFLVGILSAIGAHIFLLAVLINVGLRRIRRSARFRLPITLIATVAIVTGLLYVPYSAWMMVLVQLGGAGRNGSSYLTFAAAEHHQRLVKALLDRGVPVDAEDDGHTALNGACVANDIRIARYLISRGADIKRAPACDWVPEVTGKPPRPKVPGTSITVTP